MNIFLNNKEISLETSAPTVACLIESQGLPSVGVAVAVNNKVIPGKEWSATPLNEGDKVTVITAVCGG